MKEQWGGSRVRYSGAVTLLSKGTWAAAPFLHREWVIISCLYAVLARMWQHVGGWRFYSSLVIKVQSPFLFFMFAQVKHHLLCHITEGCNRARPWESTVKQPQISSTCVCLQTRAPLLLQDTEHCHWNLWGQTTDGVESNALLLAPFST